MTSEQAAVILKVMTGLIEGEAGATRKVVSAITNPDYKPDPKSRSAGELAKHLVMADVWFADSIADGAFVWTGEPASPPEMTDPATIASWHEKNLGDRLAKLRSMTSEQLLREVDFLHESAGGHLARPDEQSLRAPPGSARGVPPADGLQGAGDLRYERRRIGDACVVPSYQLSAFSYQLSAFRQVNSRQRAPMDC